MAVGNSVSRKEWIPAGSRAHLLSRRGTWSKGRRTLQMDPGFLTTATVRSKRLRSGLSLWRRYRKVSINSNHDCKMGQKFSTFLDQSFDTFRISDRRDKSGDRASWANSSADANTQIDSPQFVHAQGESFPNDLGAMLSVAVKY